MRAGDKVAIIHSSLTDAERRDERERIASGEAPIVIGARSAVFAPLRRLGLICVDEEHDAAYKQESDPRYDARTVAAKRASIEGAVAIYGSATPRPESWQALERLRARRPGRRGAAPVRIVDLRGEAGYPLSAPLLASLGKLAEAGEGDPAAQPPGDGARAALPSVWGDPPLLELRRCARPPPGRAPPLPPLRIRRVDARGLSRCGSVELARIGAGTAARARAGRTPAGARAFPTRRRRGRGAGSAGGHPVASPSPIERCSSGLRSSLRATTSPAFRSRP